MFYSIEINLLIISICFQLYSYQKYNKPKLSKMLYILKYKIIYLKTIFENIY